MLTCSVDSVDTDSNELVDCPQCFISDLHNSLWISLNIFAPSALFYSIAKYSGTWLSVATSIHCIRIDYNLVTNSYWHSLFTGTVTSSLLEAAELYRVGESASGSVTSAPAQHMMSAAGDMGGVSQGLATFPQPNFTFGPGSKPRRHEIARQARMASQSQQQPLMVIFIFIQILLK